MDITNLRPYNLCGKTNLFMRNQLPYSILTNCRVATMQEGVDAYGLGGVDTVVLNGEVIEWVGSEKDTPET
jgi:hypothetical protein